jgi:hypothetical protein
LIVTVAIAIRRGDKEREREITNLVVAIFGSNCCYCCQEEKEREITNLAVAILGSYCCYCYQEGSSPLELHPRIR